MSEILKLLDNNEIIEKRGDIQVSKEVSEFINLLFRLGKDKNFNQKASHEDIIRLLKATELNTYLDDNFKVLFLDKYSLIPFNYWVDLFIVLQLHKNTVNGTLSFYNPVFSGSKQRETFDFLRNIWATHRNIVYRLSALIIIHLLGMKILKDRIC